MVQTNYLEASGLAFNFLSDADGALASFLGSDNSYKPLSSLYAALSGSTFRTRADKAPAQESPSNFPLVYLFSTAQMPIQRGRSVVVPVLTRLTTWTSQPHPADSLLQCAEVAAAVAMMIRLTVHDGDASDWSSFYSNHHHEHINRVRAVQEPRLEVNAQGSQSGLCKAINEASWYHYEEVS